MLFPEIVFELVLNTVLVDSTEKSGGKVRNFNPQLFLMSSRARKLSNVSWSR